MCIFHHFFDWDFLQQSISSPDEPFFLHHHGVPVCLSLVDGDNVDNVSGLLFYRGVCAVLCTVPFKQ